MTVPGPDEDSAGFGWGAFVGERGGAALGGGAVLGEPGGPGPGFPAVVKTVWVTRTVDGGRDAGGAGLEGCATGGSRCFIAVSGVYLDFTMDILV